MLAPRFYPPTPLRLGVQFYDRIKWVEIIMNNKNKIVVYWAHDAAINKEHQQILISQVPKSVLLDIQKRRSRYNMSKFSTEDPNGNGYQMCTALHELANNMFYIKAPFDVEINFDAEGKIIVGPYSGWFEARHSSMNDSFSADFDYSYMFFCEEELEVSYMPPFLHKTSQPDFGFICSVKWDISSWFRPHRTIFQLWPGKNKIHFKKDEPMAYLKMHTDKKIVFKEFKLTPEILLISQACQDHKFILPFESMKTLYHRFTNTSMKKRLILEIKKNLVD